MQPATTQPTSPATATRLARLARLRAFLDSNGNLRLSRTLEKLALERGRNYKGDELDQILDFFEANAPLRLYRDLIKVTYSRYSCVGGCWF